MLSSEWEKKIDRRPAIVNMYYYRFFVFLVIELIYFIKDSEDL